MLKKSMLSAQLYHLLTHRLSFDLEHYRRWITPQKGPVLELGVGTGRVLFSLAHSGFTCVGIDSNPEMIGFCRELAEAQPLAISFSQQEMQSFSLAQQFQQIQLPLRTLQLLTPNDRKATLGLIAKHLQPTGHALFHISNFQQQHQQHTGIWKLYNLLPSSDGGQILIEECSHILTDTLQILHRFQHISPLHMVQATYLLEHTLHSISNLQQELLQVGLNYEVVHQHDTELIIKAAKR